ncbi:MAG: hypothetical protein LUP94_02785 [Candidatus Methanomethylicus sp.]|nr:hypothetical protein [Candidatus Methanomethylicus sp.]
MNQVEYTKKAPRKIAPLILLFLLAPSIGELLSGSSPPAEFFNPFPLILLTSLYGSGAIVVRELKVMWGKDYRTLLLLGAAYGILEEGLMVKSFFDPSWMDLGILGTFGRYAGINWVWTEVLIIYHMVFSITIPITIAGLVFPNVRYERWTSNQTLFIFLVLLAAVTVFGFFFLTPYRPPILPYLAAAASMVVLGCIANKLPMMKYPPITLAKSRVAYLIGLIFGTLFFILDFAGPYLLRNPILVMVAVFLFIYIIWHLIKRYDWDSAGSAMGRWSIVAGCLSFMITLAFLQELDTSRLDNTSFMALTGLVAAILLLLLRGYIKRRLPA